MGDLGSIPGLGRSPGEGHDNPLQYSCLGNSMDRGAWWAIVYGVQESEMTEQRTLSLYGDNSHIRQFTHLGCMNQWFSLAAQMVKNLPAMSGDLGLIPRSGKCPGEGNGCPLQYSCLENAMDRGVWRAIAHRIAESDTTEWLTLSLLRRQLSYHTIYPLRMYESMVFSVVTE